MSAKSPASPVARVATFLSQLPLWVEIILWALLVAICFGIRIYICRALPAYLWTDDSHSYANSAFQWLDTGEMVFDGRRGPTFTLLIAIAIKVWGTVLGVVWLQHALAGLAVLAAVAAARSLWGR